MDMLNVDEQGFDAQDRKLLLTIIEKFDGGPVGIDSLAAAIGEERGTIEDVLEPYLIQQGFIMRTPRGRIATRTAWLHCGLNPPARQSNEALELFGDETGEGSIALIYINIPVTLRGFLSPVRTHCLAKRIVIARRSDAAICKSAAELAEIATHPRNDAVVNALALAKFDSQRQECFNKSGLP